MKLDVVDRSSVWCAGLGNPESANAAMAINGRRMMREGKPGSSRRRLQSLATEEIINMGHADGTVSTAPARRQALAGAMQ